MTLDREFIEDLIAEGFIDSRRSTYYYSKNPSVISQDYLKLYVANDKDCSVNQSLFTGWTWLTGERGGAIKPLLCVGRKRGICQLNHFYDFNWLTTALPVLFSILFAFANFFSLAVWSRTNVQLSSKTKDRRELGLQLLLLRLLSALQLTGALLYCAKCLQLTNRFVESIPYVVFAVLFRCIILGLYRLCCLTSTFWSLFTILFLLDYSHITRKVMLFTSQLRLKIFFAVGVILALPFLIASQLLLHFTYCRVDDRRFHYLHVSEHLFRPRLSTEIYDYFRISELIVIRVILVLNAILLVVFAVKRFCACCRNQPTVVTSPESAAAEEEQTSSPAVVVVPQTNDSSTELADELRRLTFWLQMALVFGLIALQVNDYVLQVMNNGLYVLLFFIIEVFIRFGMLPVITLALSPSFQRELRRLRFALTV